MSDINVLGCIVASVVTFVSGFSWFNQKTFFPVWWRLLNKGSAQPGDGQNMATVFAAQTLAIVVQVVALELVLDKIGGEAGLDAVQGAFWGFVLGLGAAFSSLGHRLFGGFGFRVWLVEVGNDILNWAVIGLLLSALS
ncbi:MAG: hypothetical protein RL072_777 [Actinomycetota bacterium]|jgi:hypothetical protein